MVGCSQLDNKTMHVQMVRINLGELGRLVLVGGLVASCLAPSEGAAQCGVESQLDEFGEVRRMLISEAVAPIVPQESPYEGLRGQLRLFCKNDTAFVGVEFSQGVNFSGSEYLENGVWKNEAVVRVDGRDAGTWHIALLLLKETILSKAFGFGERYLSRDERFEWAAGEINAVAKGKTLERAVEDLVGFGKPKVLIQKMVSGSTFAVSIRTEEVGPVAFSWSTEGRKFRGLVREVCPASRRWRR